MDRISFLMKSPVHFGKIQISLCFLYQIYFWWKITTRRKFSDRKINVSYVQIKDFRISLHFVNLKVFLYILFFFLFFRQFTKTHSSVKSLFLFGALTGPVCWFLESSKEMSHFWSNRENVLWETQTRRNRHGELQIGKNRFLYIFRITHC